nr:hypothetical protein Abuela_1 [Pectobacterium phage Abuela]WCD42786.1 hypothetical protein Ymer_16 [Pectobacterium phage Ymer]
MSFGIQIYKNGRLAMTPEFYPYSLCKRVILSSTGTHVIETGIPSSKNVICFFKGSQSFPSVCTIQSDKTGSTIKVNVWIPINGRPPITIYIFSNYPVNVPEWGAFVYNNNELVWHSNALPLKCAKLPPGLGWQSGNLPEAKRIAITFGYCGMQTSDVANPGYWTGIYMWGVAGTATTKAEQVEYTITVTTQPYNFSVADSPLYIETDIYDQYYQQSLGV